jgi:ketosteroid isomerase-like protein
MTITAAVLLLVACAASASAQIRPRGGGQTPPPQTTQPTDEMQIRAARAESNRAIASRNLNGVARHWLPEFHMISSTNDQSAGRDAARARFQSIFASRANVVYVREPEKIEVNQAWGHAAESGRWTGRWSDSYESTRVGGVYFAKWRKVNDRWMLLAEVFVQTTCTGRRYCSTLPTQ